MTLPARERLRPRQQPRPRDLLGQEPRARAPLSCRDAQSPRARHDVKACLPVMETLPGEPPRPAPEDDLAARNFNIRPSAGRDDDAESGVASDTRPGCQL